MFVRRIPIAAAALIAGLSGCSDGGPADGDPYVGDGAFGAGFQATDAGVEDSDANVSQDPDGGLGGGSVRLRVLQGVLNLRASYLCHDPDFELDDSDAGPEPAVELPLELADDSGLELGAVTAYVDVPSMTSGAVTVHRLPSQDAGSADASTADASTADAGSAGDGAAGAPAPRCDRASLEAVLPLPMPATWVDPSDRDAGAAAEAGVALDAGLSIAARGFVSSASGGDTLTLFGSGLLIDETELESRVEDQRTRYLQEHPGENDLAEQAANQHRRALEAAYGPRFLLSRANPPRNPGSFALHFSHLIPDVPSTPAKAESGSGALHLCITVGTMEGSELAAQGIGSFDFRNFIALSDDLDPALAYRFRVFVQSAYEMEQKTCASTSLKPVAERLVEPGWFKAGGSYSLVAWGALAPEAICTTYMRGSLVRSGCSQSAEKLRPQLDIIDNR
jgi:hypothetical protein